MVDAKDVRVNNRFIRELRNERGLEYDHEFVLTEEWMGKLFGGNISISLQDLFPIPLSVEILLKCGFYWSIYHQAFHFGDMAMNEFYDLNECYPTGYQLSTFKKKELIGNSFQYIHELQNLYHSLTGKEMNIDLT